MHPTTQVAHQTKASLPWLSATTFTIQLDVLVCSDEARAVATARRVAKTACVFFATVSTEESVDESFAHVEKVSRGTIGVFSDEDSDLSNMSR